MIHAGGRLIGAGQPAFLAAEIGINHNGDLALAKEMIAAAAAAGADAVKFQNYRTEDFLSDRTLTYTYLSEGRQMTEPQWDMFKRCELDGARLAELRQACDRAGVIFFTTPTSERGIADAVQAGAPLLKNGSDFLGHLPLIRAMARTGLPTILSTGMATQEEIDDAVGAYRGAGGRDLVLLHCTSAYPASAGDLHLRKISTLAARFDCPVGLSDHSEGVIAALGAVTLGACFVEKHFTLDRNLPGPDHRFSADPAEFRSLVEAVRFLERAMGSGEIGPTAAEAENRRDARLSCVAARDLPAGHVFASGDVAFRRPATGILPQDAESLMGRRVRRAVACGTPLQLGDFE